ncbi:MAG TPA: carboxypeptidase regulatory-like domain-containing protein [Pyrinomonadaceae bacterium]|nr:carboxypeptidase regulatory-like domain-containing protein [Pyrinomonadaceae bacterium]
MFNFTTCPKQTAHFTGRMGAKKLSPARLRLKLSARCLALLVLSLVLVPSARAQVLYGSLVGNVADPQGAAVEGAKVEVTNVTTGVVSNVMTDDRGAYAFHDLQVGIYKVAIARSSFKTTVKEGVRIDANKTYRFDAQLEIGGLEETVLVAAGLDATLQTDRGDVNVTQTARQINNLPLFGSVGRNYQSLIQLVPGTTRGTGSFFLNANGNGEDNSAAGNPQRSISYNINGVSRLQNNTKIDGASIIYPWLPTNTVYVPPAEAIQEVNIVTNAFDAEQGLAGGAAINVSIKSGGNDFHGAGWGYTTNSRFRSRRFFQATNQVTNPKDILAQFGYAVSGPIILPRFGEGGPAIWSGKNKLFFFTDLERTTQRNAAGTTASVAPASLRPDANGNVNFTGTGITVYDPASNANPALRTPFANNMIPANRIDIAALEIIRRLPLPNQPGFTNNFATAGVAEFNRTNMDLKINYDGGKLTLFGRYSRSPTLIIDPPIFGEVSGPALNGGQLGTAPGLINVFGFGGTYTFTPSVVLDANVGYTRQRLGAEGFDIVSNFGLDILRIPGTNGPDRLQGGVPAFQINGGWTNIGNDNTGNPFLFRDNQYVAAANLSWLKGTHSFRFGADYLNPQLNHFQPQGGAFQTVRGSFGFSGTATRLQGNAASLAESQLFHSWADFLLGLPAQAGKVDQLRNPNSVWWKQYALYARDHWQIGRRFTLTYGLRWELFGVPRKDHTGINLFDPDTGKVFTGGLSGVPFDSGAESGTGQFLPRVGLAFRWNDKTVLRGGYGQSADPRPFQDVRNAFPIANIWSMPAVRFNGVDNGFIPVTTLRQGLINTSTAPDLSQGVITLPANTGTTTFPMEPQRKEIHSFNFMIERELPWRFTSQVGYVGTRAKGQMGFININAGPPGTGNAGRPLAVKFGLVADINSIQPYGDLTYDSLQALFTRRWANSLFGAAYTWSKTINYADNDQGPRIQYLPEKERNRGLASYDREHNLQMYGVYDLPFGKGQRLAREGWQSVVFGGFQISGVMSWMSGLPFYVIQGSAPNLLAGGSAQVPRQLNPTIAIPGGVGTAAQRGSSAGPWFDNTVLGVNCTANCAWAPETGARFGSVGRNTLRGPGFFETDLSIFRTFNLSESVNLQFRAEALNATNHANFANPQSDINNATFGFITSTYGPNQSRQWRFGMRLGF